MGRIRLSAEGRDAFLAFVGRCPHCGDQDFGPGASVIKTPTARSILIRCARCGLEWNMTHHRILKMVELEIAAAKERQLDDPEDEASVSQMVRRYESFRDALKDFALDETRGRRPKPQPQLTAAELTEAAIERVDRLHELRVREVKRRLTGE